MITTGKGNDAENQFWKEGDPTRQGFGLLAKPVTEGLKLVSSDCLVVASDREPFSIAVLEALAAGVPVLLTPECNFPELVRAGAAVEVAATAAAIEGGIRDLLNLPGTKLADMGGCGRNLVKTAYTWPEVARQMGRVYKWLADKGPQPETVQCV